MIYRYCKKELFLCKYYDGCYKSMLSMCLCFKLFNRTNDWCRITWASTRENLSLGFVNNIGADQPVHPRSLISTFVFYFLESIISKLAMNEISIFLLVSVAEQAGLNLTLAETPKTGFLAVRPIFSCSYTPTEYVN